MVAAMEARTVRPEQDARPRPTRSDDHVGGAPRPESPERWHRALARAMAAGLEVFRVADTGELMVTSASKLDTLHRTDGRRCSCEAALAGDAVCQHRAVARFVLGWLAPAAAVCATCLGKGHLEEYAEAEGVPVAWQVPCSCPQADAWVDALLGGEAAAETAYVAHYAA